MKLTNIFLISFFIATIILSCKPQQVIVKKMEDKASKNLTEILPADKWILQKNNQDVMVGGQQVYIQINQAQNTISGFLGCNLASAQILNNAINDLKITQFKLTQRYCDDVDDHTIVTELLNQANRYSFNGNELVFYKDQLELLKFKAATNQTL